MGHQLPFEAGLKWPFEHLTSLALPCKLNFLATHKEPTRKLLKVLGKDRYFHQTGLDNPI